MGGIESGGGAERGAHADSQRTARERRWHELAARHQWWSAEREREGEAESGAREWEQGRVPLFSWPASWPEARTFSPRVKCADGGEGAWRSPCHRGGRRPKTRAVPARAARVEPPPSHCPVGPQARARGSARARVADRWAPPVGYTTIKGKRKNSSPPLTRETFAPCNEILST